MKRIIVSFPSGEQIVAVPVKLSSNHTQVLSESDFFKYGPASFQSQFGEWINNRYVKGLDKSEKLAN